MKSVENCLLSCTILTDFVMFVILYVCHIYCIFGRALQRLLWKLLTYYKWIRIRDAVLLFSNNVGSLINIIIINIQAFYSFEECKVEM